MARTWGFIGLLGATIVLTSCSRKPTMPNFGSEDGLKISTLVEDINENKARPTEVKKLITLPEAKLKRLPLFAYNLAENPKIDGNTATATVRISTDGGEDKGTQVWKFEKTGDQWVVKDAPLP